jgi:hypothetical protein
MGGDDSSLIFGKPHDNNSMQRTALRPPLMLGVRGRLKKNLPAVKQVGVWKKQEKHTAAT